MPISDWSSGVCSSDLAHWPRVLRRHHDQVRLALLLARLQDGRGGHAWQVAHVEQRGIQLILPEDTSTQAVGRCGDRMRTITFGALYGHVTQATFKHLDAYPPIQIGSASCRERVCHYV